MNTSIEARDEGIDRTVAANRRWFEDVQKVVEELSVGWEGTGEDIRQLVLDQGHSEPSHPNAWGPLILWAAKNGLLEKTGEYRQMKIVSSHARVNPVWKRIEAMDWEDNITLTFLIGIVAFVGVIGYVVIDDITVQRPKRNAWVAACKNSGGTPVPTSVTHGKSGTQYGEYVCTKLNLIEVPK